MKKHILQENYERMFGSIKEDWWDDMDASAQAAYIKKHPASKQAQQADDDAGGEEPSGEGPSGGEKPSGEEPSGEEKSTEDMSDEELDAEIEDTADAYDEYGKDQEYAWSQQQMGGPESVQPDISDYPGAKKHQKAKAVKWKRQQAAKKAAEPEEKPSGEKPSGEEPKPEPKPEPVAEPKPEPEVKPKSPEEKEAESKQAVTDIGDVDYAALEYRRHQNKGPYADWHMDKKGDDLRSAANSAANKVEKRREAVISGEVEPTPEEAQANVQDMEKKIKNWFERPFKGTTPGWAPSRSDQLKMEEMLKQYKKKVKHMKKGFFGSKYETLMIDGKQYRRINEGVMKQHQINKLEEGWWDNMSDAGKKSYIKKHGSAPNVAGDDDYDMGAPDRVPNQDFRSDPTDDDYSVYDDPEIARISDEDDEDDYDMGAPDRVPNQDFRSDPTDDDYSVYDDPNFARIPDEEGGEEPSGEEKPSAWSQKAQRAKDDLEQLSDPDEIGDWIEDNKWSLSGGKLGRAADLEFAPVQKAYAELEDAYMEGDWDVYDKAKEDFTKLTNQKLDSQKVSRSRRTGNELNQETLMIDGKQYRRISEGVEKQPKPKYEFSEFYKRFKK
jgi:hypothetical protein